MQRIDTDEQNGRRHPAGSLLRTCATLTLTVVALSGCAPSRAPAPAPTLPDHARLVGACLELKAAEYQDAVHVTLPTGFQTLDVGTRPGVVTVKDWGADEQQAIAIYESPTTKKTAMERVLDAWAHFTFGSVAQPETTTPWPNAVGADVATSTAIINDRLPARRVEWYVLPSRNTAFVVVVAGPADDQALTTAGSSITTSPCPA